MKKLTRQERVDALIEQFWRKGYLTVSRRYGKYLPEPNPVGKYAIDAVAKYRRKIAVGLVLEAEELNDPKIISKLNFLASRNSNYSNRNTTLYVGVPEDLILKAEMIVAGLDSNAQNNIKIIGVPSSKN
ncbi:MAG: hypothetical protein HND52_03470 [Ignavibacteriae bacterium]|jgi:hypothetical protein|nr:hypothetical protein [Ignavibacteriota bacterium]NOG97014.1 hypothetical protein [Ignavibacteriota bacterium]